MSVKNILLISTNAMLHMWCRAELGDEFKVTISTETAYAAELKVLGEADCVLIDFTQLEEVVMIAMYNYLHNMKGLPLVFISSNSQPEFVTEQMQEFYPQAKFLSMYGTTDTLGPLVRSICQADAEEEAEGLPKDDAPHHARIMRDFYQQIERAAKTDDCVLLLGECGCGKTWTAKLIHSKSSRQQKKLVHINVAEFNENIIESNLFGTVRGAFTGATEREGMLSAANGSSIFFDEIAEMPTFLQAKLLNVIENYTYRKLGSVKECSFDARMMFATNADIQTRIKERKFREDLFYRINALTIQVPPLREHKEDIPSLAQNFARERNKTISPLAMEKLCDYYWPGNIRQLRNSVYRACTFAQSKEITAENLQIY